MNDEERKAISHNRRVRALAIATLQRAATAGIPERFMRIGKEEFREIISKKQHDSEEIVENLCTFIYDRANELRKIPYILIDGGNQHTRRIAGFAVLFRLIACDMGGLYQTSASLAHRFQSFKPTEATSRNEFVDNLKDYDVLLIGDFHPSQFNVHLDTGSFMDELLASRYDTCKPTIITFEEPINPSNVTDRSVGSYMARLARLDFDKVNNPSNEILRIRVGMK